jgi:hypothetical protein
MQKKRAEAQPKWGHIGLLAAIAGWLIWYALDALSASSRFDNLLLIVPASIVGVGLVIALLVQEFWAPRTSNVAKADPSPDEPADDLRTSLTLMLLLAGYVGTMSWIGLDIATFLFIGLSLFALDERRILTIVGFSGAFTFISLGAMGQLVSLPQTAFLEWMLP